VGNTGFLQLPSERVSQTPEEFLRSVEATIAAEGSWQAKTEYRMGGGTTVTVTPSNSEGHATFLADATWGSLQASGLYDSLEHALRGLPLISFALFNVRDQGGWKGLVSG
jgi:hypothetical protein